METIVYAIMPVSELPKSNGDYTIILITGEIRAVRWQDDHFEWTGNLAPATHWLNPVQLSTLIEDEIKSFNESIKYLDGLIKDMLNDNNKSEWVDINDKKPTNHQYVLIVYNGTVQHAIYSFDSYENIFHFIDEYREQFNLSTSQITHWQPLPSAPKP